MFSSKYSKVLKNVEEDFFNIIKKKQYFIMRYSILIPIIYRLKRRDFICFTQLYQIALKRSNLHFLKS